MAEVTVTGSQRTLHHVASSETVPEGRHALRFEFEPTGAPDIAHGKGTPGRARCTSTAAWR
ncbi:hypothetical protein [Streptomyces sp. NBC_01481]|uniref:hypothetical protein n=1 Tax=Streptomyces sp. NBC_01481 TaxID=2975869 RepID=UPI002253A168|nr:hypothetical protein [Streptomyces sp. NBC_01481]MCX4585971.1 hypothetical protein [Streptomyces sp. NBC_01481]